jgi:cytidylate kinase
MASASLREGEGLEAQVEGLMVRSGLSREEAYARAGRSAAFAYMPRQDYLDLVTSVILQYAEEGDAMLVGRGGQMILRDEPGVLHIQVHASFETRVYNIIQREGVKWREAAHRVRRADEQRAGYMRRFYNVDWLSSELYDLAISTDNVSTEAAVDMIILAAQAVGAAGMAG